jgi:hypothetical protein
MRILKKQRQRHNIELSKFDMYWSLDITELEYQII